MPGGYAHVDSAFTSKMTIATSSTTTTTTNTTSATTTATRYATALTSPTASASATEFPLLSKHPPPRSAHNNHKSPEQTSPRD